MCFRSADHVIHGAPAVSCSDPRRTDWLHIATEERTARREDRYGPFPIPTGRTMPWRCRAPFSPTACPIFLSFPDRGSCLPATTVHKEPHDHDRSEEHTSELQSLMRISYAVFCLKKKKKKARSKYNYINKIRNTLQITDITKIIIITKRHNTNTTY